MWLYYLLKNTFLLYLIFVIFDFFIIFTIYNKQFEIHILSLLILFLYEFSFLNLTGKNVQLHF